MIAAWPVVCATGHRPQHLPNRGWCRERLRDGARWLRDSCGTEVAVSGMALGWDTDWANAALDAGLRLWAFCPYPQQPDVWDDEADQAEWRRLIALAERVVYAGDLDTITGKARKWAATGLLFKRNDLMLAESAAVFACWDERKTSGGTYDTVRKAKGEKSVRGQTRSWPIVHVDPYAQTTRIIPAVNHDQEMLPV